MPTAKNIERPTTFGLRLVVAATLISPVTIMPAQALDWLAESEMSNITGQSGITIEQDANVNVGGSGTTGTGSGTAGSGSSGSGGITIELAATLDIAQIRYVDEGALDINNLHLSGLNGTMLDNIKLTLDLAGDGEVLDYGFSELAQRGADGVLDPAIADVADAMASYAVNGTYGKQFNDGDLVMHLSPLTSGDHSNLDDYLKAIDFELGIDSVVIGGNPDSTTMFSDIYLAGYLGPTDIVVRNDATDKTLANGDQVLGSELQLSSHFMVDNGTIDWNVGDVILIFNLAGVGIEGLRVHNERGNDTLGHFGMASLEASISAGTSAKTGVEGMSIHDVEFRGDIDMPTFRIGNESIGGVYFTDFVISDTSMMVYGH